MPIHLNLLLELELLLKQITFALCQQFGLNLFLGFHRISVYSGISLSKCIQGLVYTCLFKGHFTYRGQFLQVYSGFSICRLFRSVYLGLSRSQFIQVYLGLRICKGKSIQVYSGVSLYRFIQGQCIQVYSGVS